MKLYLGTNTKMYKTIAQTCSYLRELKDGVANVDSDETEIFVIPSFTTLYSANMVLHDGSVLLGAQNMGWEEEGQFSGEISPLMLREVGVRYVMIGHSERRHVLRETDEMERKRVNCALRNGLTPLLCIGETDEEKALGLSNEVLRRQLKIALCDVSPKESGRLRIAYEPVWAIGVNGKPASCEYAAEKHAVIRETLCELFGAENAEEIPLLYGGSVNAENAAKLIRVPQIDGLFIGRSAWNAGNFLKLIEAIRDAWCKKQDRENCLIS